MWRARNVCGTQAYDPKTFAGRERTEYTGRTANPFDLGDSGRSPDGLRYRSVVLTAAEQVPPLLAANRFSRWRLERSLAVTE